MKYTHLFSSLLVLIFGATVYGQEAETTVPGNIAITDVFVHFGSFTEKTYYSGVEDFRQLAPESELLMEDLSDFGRGYGGSTFTGNAMLYLSVGVEFKEKDKLFYKANPLLRLGMSYYSANTLTGGVSRRGSFPVDTLVSVQTGQEYIVDSTSYESYEMQYFTDQVRLDASFVLRTNPEARWSFYGGVGLAAGVSINARTEIYYYNQRGDDDYHGRGYPGRGSYKSEQFLNKMNFALLVYIPIGLDFRLGKEKEFWKRTHLFYELSPGINFTSIPELGTLSHAAFRNGLGLRVSWG